MLSPLGPAECALEAGLSTGNPLHSGTGAGGGAGSRVSLSPLHTRGQETLGAPAPCSDRPRHRLPPALPSTSMFLSAGHRAPAAGPAAPAAPVFLPPRSPPCCSICSRLLPAPCRPAPSTADVAADARRSTGQAPRPPWMRSPERCESPSLWNAESRHGGVCSL